MEHLIIEGFMGSGKGAVAKLLGKGLNVPVVDVDKLVAERLNMTSADIYDRFGEIFYRAEETIVLMELAGDKKQSIIVLGSGVAMMPQNQEILKKLGTVVYIELSESAILKKMRGSRKHDWIKAEDWDERVLKLYKEREPAYRKTADIVIHADGKKVDEVASAILAAVRKRED
ncbi:MAG: shikimate kinase [Lachnospiraceae bacterium]|nr:shikimate kinase [Lachnospiraceae bacterium]